MIDDWSKGSPKMLQGNAAWHNGRNKMLARAAAPRQHTEQRMTEERAGKRMFAGPTEKCQVKPKKSDFAPYVGGLFVSKMTA